MAFPSLEESNLNSFDDFFDKDLYDLNSGGDDRESPQLDDVFASGYAEACNEIGLAVAPRAESPQPWREGLWCLGSKQTPGLPIGKVRKSNRSGQKFVAPTHLVNNENFAVRSPITSFRTETKTIPTSPRTNLVDKGQSTARRVIREQTLSPTPMYAKLPAGNKMGNNDEWQQDFQNFHLQMPDNGTYLSPQHVHPPRVDSALQQANMRIRAHNNATAIRPPPSPTKYHLPFTQFSRSMNNQQNTEHYIPQPPHTQYHERMEPLSHHIYPGSGLDQFGAPFWTTESLHSSDSSNHSQESHFSVESYEQNYDVPLNDAWMSPPANSVYVKHEHVPVIAAPVPQRVPYQVLHQQQNDVHEGLGIHYADVNEIGTAVSHAPVNGHSNVYRADTPAPTLDTATSYPPLPPFPSHTFSSGSPFTTPRKQDMFSRSPSPSISRTRRSRSIGVGQRSPSRNDNTHNRRKSIHKPGPIKDTTSQETHRRTRSSSRPPRTPKTPKTPKTPTSAGFAQIGFVNYTSKDCLKLMNDVAPSGSSKTRARREQEAKDKRKKLSEAAFQAVRRAGGDVRALEEAILV